MGDIAQAVAAYYTNRLREHGPTPSGVDWSTGASQELRFAQLIRAVGDVAEPGLSVIDVGCGYGALLDALRRAGFQGSYVGLDLSPAMLDAARALYGGVPGVAFRPPDEPYAACDIALASGIFNVKMDVDPSDWRAWIVDTLDRMAAASRRAFAVNFLTAHADADRRRPDLFYAMPGEWLEYCLTRYSRRVTLLHDYPLWEFTLHVRVS